MLHIDQFSLSGRRSPSAAVADLSRPFNSLPVKPWAKRHESIDVKPLSDWYQKFDKVENLVLDLCQLAACKEAVSNTDVVFNLAADMGVWDLLKTTKLAVC